MFLDASAMVAIIAAEADGPELSRRLDAVEHPYASAVSVYETTLALVRSLKLSVAQAEDMVAEFLQRAGVEVIPITPEIGRRAIAAFARYGRGRHPAGLNMGDCFAYACARALAVPLLYKGEDFAQTDIAVS